MAQRKRIELVDQASGRPFVSAFGEGRAHLRHVRDLEADAAELRRVEARMRSTVQLLRANGASWAVIGHALGISKQAAQSRFGRDILV